jgi:hypothetical protein
MSFSENRVALFRIMFAVALWLVARARGGFATNGGGPDGTRIDIA